MPVPRQVAQVVLGLKCSFIGYKLGIMLIIKLVDHVELTLLKIIMNKLDNHLLVMI